jgi:hypothetical protein
MSYSKQSKTTDSYTWSAKIIHIGFFTIIFCCCLMIPYWQLGTVPFGSDHTDDTVFIDINTSPIAED